MESFPTPSSTNRLGMHYFPDTLHYRESDLAAWLPELVSLGIGWITLVAPLDRAIPEGFINGLISAGIEPVLHFHVRPGMWDASACQAQDLRLFFEVYARWGVHYVVLFDRPNQRCSWPAEAWAQPDLVERFLDLYLPLAGSALDAGLVPVFPPLEPGGDYWDTAFLRQALQGIQRRGPAGLRDRLALGAYAWTGGHSLQWGAGGPERWPAARPYAAHTEDQRGFRIFDWYLAIANAVLNRRPPLLILGGGSRMSDARAGAKHLNEGLPHAGDFHLHTRQNLAAAALMAAQGEADLPSGDAADGTPLEPVPAQVLACHFWLFAAASGSPYEADAWFRPGGQNLPIVEALREMAAGRNRSPGGTGARQVPTAGEPVAFLADPVSGAFPASSPHKPVEHYLLLPAYEWGVSDWHLDIIRPFIKKYHPVVGFSPQEACCARQVTVMGGWPAFPEEVIANLRRAGCLVRQIGADGTDIATELARI